MQRIRLAQVGLGAWGLNWAQEVLPTVETVEMVGYADIDRAARERLGTELSIPPHLLVASLEAALASSDCEAVLITLPMRLHAPAARAALEAGKHVLVEKPFTATLDDAVALVDLAAERRLTLMVSQNYRHYPAARAAARHVAMGGQGRLHAVAIDFRRFVTRETYRYWDLEQPLLSDMAVHHLDLMRMVIGKEPLRLACRSWRPGGTPLERPFAAHAMLSFPGQVAVSYRASFASRGSETPWGGAWFMELDEGAVAWTSRGNQGDRLGPERLALIDGAGREVAQPLQALRHIDRAGTTADFAQAIIDGREPPLFSSGRDNLMSLAMVEACIRSAARDGEWVEPASLLPTRFRA